MPFMLLVDNNVLSALAKIGRLHLFQRISGNVFTTSSVIVELNKALSLGLDFIEEINKAKAYRGGWLKIVSPTIKEIAEAESIIDKSLSFTDAECIAVARNRKLVFLTDDKCAGKRALGKGVRVWDLKLFFAICVKRGLIGSREELSSLLLELLERDGYRFSNEDEKFLYELFEGKRRAKD